MSIETRYLEEFAVVWPVLGTADDRGRPRVGPKEQHSVRWEHVKSTVANTHKCDADVMADEAIPVGSIVWEGSLEDFKQATNREELLRVVAIEEVPDVKAHHTQYTWKLEKFNGTLPEAV